MGKSAAVGCLLGAVTLSVVPPAAAQRNLAPQLSVGYSIVVNDEVAVNQSTLPLGFQVDAAFALHERIMLAAELNGHFKMGITPSASMDRVVAPLPTQEFQALSFNRPETGFCSPTLRA